LTYHRKAEICPPAIRLRACDWLHFIHDGSVFSVKRCLDSRFRAAVKELHPGDFKDARTNQLMKEHTYSDENEPLDLIARWYLLNELSCLGCPMELFQTRMMALYSLRARVVCGSVEQR